MISPSYAAVLSVAIPLLGCLLIWGLGSGKSVAKAGGIALAGVAAVALGAILLIFTDFTIVGRQILFVSVLFFIVAALFLLKKSPNLREGATLATGAVLLALSVTVFAAVGEGQRPGYVLFDVIDGLPIAFQAEPLGAMFGVIASGLWLVNSIYSIGYMRGGNEKHQTRFYMCFMVAIAAAMGVAYAANLFTLFIFYEILTLSTFPLVTHKGDDNARRGGRVYLGLLLATSIGLFLPAIVWTYAIAETTDFAVGGILSSHREAVAPIAGVLLALYAFGIGKAALMPIHSWLPNAMVAPTPVSAFLHAVAVVKAGVFCILKVAVYVFGIDIIQGSSAADTFMWIAAGSILLASIIAMNQDNLKARLAYSTVSQLSYVTLGAMLATSMGVMGGATQIAAHALGKITLFMCAGAIYVAHHKTLVSELRGMGRIMPFTFAAFFIGSLSIIGLPPMAGSWPKFFLMLGAAEAGERLIIVVLMVSSILNVVYLLSIPVQAFLKARPGEPHAFEGGWYDGPRYDAGDAAPARPPRTAIAEAPLFCLVPIGITAAGALVLFFLMDPLYDYLTPLVGGGS